MVVHVVRVVSIPFGLSALIEEQPGSVVVWLLASAWSKEKARRVEKALAERCAAGDGAETFTHLDLHAV